MCCCYDEPPWNQGAAADRTLQGEINVAWIFLASEQEHGRILKPWNLRHWLPWQVGIYLCIYCVFLACLGGIWKSTWNLACLCTYRRDQNISGCARSERVSPSTATLHYQRVCLRISWYHSQCGFLVPSGRIGKMLSLVVPAHWAPKVGAAVTEVCRLRRTRRSKRLWEQWSLYQHGVLVIYFCGMMTYSVRSSHHGDEQKGFECFATHIDIVDDREESIQCTLNWGWEDSYLLLYPKSRKAWFTSHKISRIHLFLISFKNINTSWDFTPNSHEIPFTPH